MISLIGDFDATDALSAIASSSAPVFEDLYPIFALIAGIGLALTLGVLLIKSILHR